MKNKLRDELIIAYQVNPTHPKIEKYNINGYDILQLTKSTIYIEKVYINTKEQQYYINEGKHHYPIDADTFLELTKKDLRGELND